MTYLLCVSMFIFFSRPLVGSVAGLQQWAMAQRGVAALEAGPLNRFGLESTYYNKGLCGQQCRRHTPLYCGVLYRCSCRVVGTAMAEGQMLLNISFHFKASPFHFLIQV